MTAQEKKRQLTITFENEETKDYVMLIARRKGLNLAKYIVDSFELDDRLGCDEITNQKRITPDICEGCDFFNNCPDKAGAP